ncbi:MAG: N-6 DNA methylase [Thiobacillus sp.]|nr:N-6 DNA methylase [Thiobacillus sp.]
MRTHAHAKTTDHLGRYYTGRVISQLLVDSLPQHQRTPLLDLGAGEGSLSVAVSCKRDVLDLVTVDVDARAARVLKRELNKGGFSGTHRHIRQDALSVSLPTYISEELRVRPILAVCNPPFLVPKWRKQYGEIAEDVGFSGCLPAIKNTDAAILFLAQNLRVLEREGTVGIIVPDSLVCASKYLGFRRALVERYDVRQAIRLPRASFVGTDAQAHILVIAKRCPTSEEIVLSNFMSPHSEVQSISVDRDRAAQRLDYLYHASEITPDKPTLASVTIDLRRGSFNSAEVRTNPSFILHTTNISVDMRGNWYDFGKKSAPLLKTSPNSVFAETGDILIARVGRNAADKIIGIAGGSVAISDCLYRLRVKPQYRVKVMQALVSDSGRAWLQAHAHGVAASQISKVDLFRFPLVFCKPTRNRSSAY